MTHRSFIQGALASAFLSACGGDDASGPVMVDATSDASRVVDAALEASVAPADAYVPPVPPPVPPARRDCVGGTYAGKYDCSVDGLPIWGGSLAFDLLQAMEGGGEFSELVVRPGTQISGTDGYTGKFDGELAGKFDCTTGTFTGSLVRAVYLFPGANYPVAMMGDLTGSYSPGSPPALSGTMGPLTSPEWGSVGATATCTWNTERTGDVSGGDGVLDDAGVNEPTTCPSGLSCVAGGLGENGCKDNMTQALPSCDAASARCTQGDRAGICRPGLLGGECFIACVP